MPTPVERNAFQYSAFQRNTFQIPPPVVSWPPPEQVKYGTVYGPTGVEYTGKLRAGQTWLRRR